MTSLEDKDKIINELNNRISDLQQKEQDKQIEQLKQKLNYLEEKITLDDKGKHDENLFNDAETNNSTPECIIEDDKVREILLANEKPVYHERFRGPQFGGKHDRILFTNQRIIFYNKTGTFSKKIGCDVLPIHNLRIQSYEEKGLLSKKGILKIDIGLGKPLTWEGSPSKIQPVYQLLSSLVV
ncbi:MAG: PH domain-containing protein [Nitrosarchaeum sp.]